MKVAVTFLLLSLLHAVTSLEDADYWLREGQARLKDKLQQRNNEGRARNVILFIGDGMGINTVTAARIRQGQLKGGSGEEYRLSFEKFPHVGLSKTYNVDKQVPDSAATATAMLTGVKTKYKFLGMAPEAPPESCSASQQDSKRHHIEGVATWAQKAGKSTGFVTTTCITEATPAALYSHVTQRSWECDNKIPEAQSLCVKDIARQLVEDEPGRSFNVVLGGGQNQMGITFESQIKDTCIRTDGKNLPKNWLQGKEKALYVNSKSSLMSADIDDIDHLIGLFSPDKIPYIYERNSEHPSLVNMTLQAIKLLKKNKNGFFLMVEAGRIDHAHHDNMAKAALAEAGELEETVAAAFAATDPTETLIIVTGDHSHAFTVNGYPTRGNDILGFANKPGETEYETISYANGPGYLDHRVDPTTATRETWKLLATMDRTKDDYKNLATMYLKSETHGGEDVAVLSTGPGAHLLTGVFEQSYIGHVMSYAACMGPATHLCDTSGGDNKPIPSAASFANQYIKESAFFVCIFYVILLICTLT